MRGQQIRHRQRAGFVLRTAFTHDRGLILRRKKRAAMTLRAETAQRIEGDVARQILRLAAQPVERPRAHRRPRLRGIARVKHRHRRLVRLLVRVHRREHAQVVRALRHVRKKLAHPLPALSMLRELPRRSEQLRRALVAARFAVIALEQRLVVKRVHMRHTALHEHHDHPLRLRRKHCPATQRRLRAHARKCEITKAAKRATEEVASGWKRTVHGVNRQKESDTPGKAGGL